MELQPLMNAIINIKQFGYNLDGFCKEFAGIFISSKNPSDTTTDSNYVDDILYNFILPLKPSLLLLLILPTKISPINGRNTMKRKCTKKFKNIQIKFIGITHIFIYCTT